MSTDSNLNEEEAREQLLDLAADFYDQFDQGNVPRMQIPTRTKTNIEYDEAEKVWVYGDRSSTRSAKTVSGAQKLLKATYTIDFLADQADQDRSSTLRELYYLSESWDLDEAQFNSQDESNNLIEDLEIVSEVKREDFPCAPRESGAKVMGPLLLREQTRRATATSTVRRRRPGRVPDPEPRHHRVPWTTTRTSSWPSRPVVCATDSSRTGSTTTTTASWSTSAASPPATRRLIKADARRTRPPGRGVRRR